MENEMIGVLSAGISDQPNDEEGENALRAELEPVLAKLFAGASFAIERDTTSQLRLNLRVRCDTDANAATLLSNLAA